MQSADEAGSLAGKSFGGFGAVLGSAVETSITEVAGVGVAAVSPQSQDEESAVGSVRPGVAVLPAQTGQASGAGGEFVGQMVKSQWGTVQ